MSQEFQWFLLVLATSSINFYQRIRKNWEKQKNTKSKIPLDNVFIVIVIHGQNIKINKTKTDKQQNQ